MGSTVTLRSPEGETVDVPADQVATYTARRFTVETPDQQTERIKGDIQERHFGGVGGHIVAAGLGAARTASLGLSDVALDQLGASDVGRGFQEQNPISSVVGEVGGALLPGGANKLIGDLGATIAEAPKGASTLRQAGQAALGHGAEGVIYGLGSGVSQLALSDDPVTLERAASVLSSNMLFGGVVGGGLGGASKLVEKGMARAASVLREAQAARSSDVLPELGELSGKELNAARDAEVAALESARAPKRQEFVSDLDAYRQGQRGQKLFLATQQEDVKGIGEIKQMSRAALDADRRIDRLLNNPIALAENPKPALGALQQQENALQKILKNEDDLRKVFAADTRADRMVALDAMPKALEDNRAMQGRIRELMAEPQSQRLTDIGNAKEALSMPKPEPSAAEKALKWGSYGTVAAAAHAIPVIGQIPGVAHFVADKVSSAIAGAVFGRLGNGISEAAAHTAATAEAFAKGAGKVARPATVAASSILKSVRYAPPKAEEQEPKTLVQAFKARTDEIKSQTAYDHTGTPKMRPEARQKMADRLGPMRAISPVFADRIETIAARKLEYLASIIPRRPDIGGIQIGPDNWQPSDMQMRAFARAAHAVEDPGGVETRAATGQITPEDAEAYWAVYPERAMAFQEQVMGHLAELDKTVPYQRKVALSIFAKTPVDASMHPNVLEVLQGQFADEPGSKGGTQHPTAQPQFGSISKSLDHPTPSQSRASR